MAWTRVQAVESYAAYSPTNAATITASGAGNILVVLVGTKSQSTSYDPVISVVDNKSNTYTLLATATDTNTGDGPNDAEIWYCLSPASGVTTVTVTVSSTPSYASRLFVVVGEYTPPSTVTVEASTNGATTTSSSLSTGSITTTGSSDLLIAGGRMNASAVSSPFALTVNDTTNTFAFADSLSQAAGSYSATFTVAAGIATAVIGAFKSGSASAINFLGMLGCGS